MNEDTSIPENGWSTGQQVEIIDGPFNAFKGTIVSIDRQKKRLRVIINLWGKDTPVELNFLQVKPLE